MSITPFGEGLPILAAGTAELAEISTDEARIRQVYDSLGLDGLLYKFAFGEPLSPEDPRTVDEEITDYALLQYALVATYIATKEGKAEMDIELIKGAFVHVYDSMDGAIEAKLVRPQKPGILAKILERAKILRPEEKRPSEHIHRLDDHFWGTQFPNEMAKQTFVDRQPEDTDAGYAARMVYHTLHSRVFSHYSYVQQATAFV